MVLMSPMVHEKVWLDKPRYDAAERRYYERLSQSLASGKADDSSQLANSSSESNVIDDPLATTANACALKPKEVQEENVCKRSNEQTCKKPSSQTAGKADVKEVKKDSQSSKSEKAKKRTETESKESVCQKAAQPSLSEIDEIAVTSNTVSVEVANRVVALEKENQELSSRMEKLEQKIAALEKQLAAASAANTTCAVPKKAAAPAPAPAKQSKDDDDDGVDLFGSDSEEEDAEAAKIKEQRLAEYAARKSKKPALIAKSSIVLDVKPWDDETDMKLLEQEVRKIACDGLLWGASKLVPLAYGIHKLQISCVVEDEKVSVDWLQETIQEIEDYVQSVDIAAFNKI